MRLRYDRDIGKKVKFVSAWASGVGVNVGVIDYVYSDGVAANVRATNGMIYYVPNYNLTPYMETPEEIDRAQREAFADQYL